MAGFRSRKNAGEWTKGTGGGEEPEQVELHSGKKRACGAYTVGPSVSKSLVRVGKLKARQGEKGPTVHRARPKGLVWRMQTSTTPNTPKKRSGSGGRLTRRAKEETRFAAEALGEGGTRSEFLYLEGTVIVKEGNEELQKGVQRKNIKNPAVRVISAIGVRGLKTNPTSRGVGVH